VTEDALDPPRLGLCRTPARSSPRSAGTRAGAGAVARSLAERAPRPEGPDAVPTTVLWPEHDPLFVREWSDRLGEFYSDITLTFVDGVGHYTPLECPQEFARR
jgi:pimeloyl-ACP methyl ester carboxylesterase